MRLMTLATLVCLSTTAALAQSTAVETFELERQIVIDAAQSDVFCFAGNPLNDSVWRSEVNGMFADGPWQVGTRYYEDASLGRKPHYLTTTELRVLDFPRAMVVETPKDALLLRIERSFEELEDGRTRFTYRLIVDTRMPFEATGIRVPAFVSKLYYGRTVSQYQKKLKSFLESAPPGLCN